MKVILIHIYYTESGYGDKLNYPPLGIAYLSENLEKEGVDHAIIDQGLGYSQEDTLKKLEELKPEWIGVSLNSILVNRTQVLIKMIKEKMPSVKIVVGGPHVTTKQAGIFQELQGINYAIVGEGEESFFELIDGQQKEEIEGLIYMGNDGNLISNARRITQDIDIIPFPKFKRFELDSYLTKAIPVISSRGCPFKCIFCQQSSLLSKKWRGVTADHFLNVLKYWQEDGRTDIQVMDDNFAYDPKRLEEMTERYEKENLHDMKLTLVGGVRISSASIKNLNLLKRMGVEFISFGIESFSDEVLRFIKKGTTTEKIEETIKNSTDMGFKVRLFFIIGFPHQTADSLRKTYKMILKYPVYQVRFFNLIPYENTGMMEWLKDHGKMVHPPSEYMNDFKRYQDIPVFEAENTMSPNERTRELKIARKFGELIDERSKYLFDELGNYDR